MNNIKAYMRVSTDEEKEIQSFKSQEQAIRRWCKENKYLIKEECICRDDASGKNFDREGWTALEDGLTVGDTVVIKDILRFASDCGSGLSKYYELLQKDINLVFLDNPAISSDYIRSLSVAACGFESLTAGQLAETIPGLLFRVEFDRTLKKQEQVSRRIREGISASEKKSGRKTGQIDKLTQELESDIRLYLSDGTVKQVELMKKHNISRNTLKKYAELIRKELMRSGHE